MRARRPQFLIFPFLLMLTLVFTIACGAAATPTPAPEDAMNQTGETMTKDSGAMADAPAPAEKELVPGWYQGREVRYYDFGSNTPVEGNGVALPPSMCSYTA
jgi:hypothetical protein